ncbi:zona pellucida sperm-binding protein 3-like [Gymnogyps californianus]|uniref:zona pellucida sperm-binding protein 3-like n=1 Tax=Gymnogyps californianus TaxID=33616 RepID=UPI0021C6B793|nr:zona pellucida sperm-binding protein 3-like [Gymnogyps californianus]
MGSGGSLGVALLCWVLAAAASYSPWGFPQRDLGVLRVRGDSSWSWPHVPSFSQPSPWAWVDVSQLQAAAPLHPVAVQCQEAQVVVTVHRDLFGTGRLVKAADLTLGSAACLPVAQSAAESTVTFVAGLHECGSTLQMTPDSLIYKTSLSYKPTPSGNLVIVRTNAAVVPIECHYPRKSNVSSNAIRPTWVPFRSTLSAEERLTFSLRLMNDDWSSERLSNGFQLGESLHLQADVASGHHVPLRLFVDDCVATLSPDRNSSPRYALIDLSGCLVDGRSDDTTSAFISPRPRQETLQFVVDAFKFAGDDRNLIYITCHLKVSPADQAPNPLNKACSFNKASSLWAPVEGTGDICSCCETGNCPLYGGYSRRINPPARWLGRRLKRDIASRQGGSSRAAEAEVSVGPLLILDSAQGLWSSSGGLAPAGKTPHGAAEGLPMLVQVAMLTAATVLSLTALGLFLVCRKCSCPPGVSL